MRWRPLLILFLLINLAWATAFYAYVRSQPGAPFDPKTDLTRFNPANLTSNKSAPGTNILTASNGQATAAASTNLIAAQTNKVVTTAASSGTIPLIPIAPRQFSWRDLQSEDYLKYVENLKRAGVPPAKLRQIIISDINDLFDQKRLQAAVAADPQWWKAESYFGLLQIQAPPNNFEEERNDLMARLLGPEAEKEAKLPPLVVGNNVPLTGPVLGALSHEKFVAVQEICSRSMERHNSYFMARAGEGQPMDPVELAKLRGQTRTDLGTVLSAEEMEDFLLRYSHNGTKLRQDLRGFEPTPEEFRKIFRAIDGIEHQMQVEYGGPEALSPRQREEFDRQRERAIQEVLPPARYKEYALTRDPLYKQAQVLAQQYGLSAKAVQPLYRLQQSADARRQQIFTNASLSPEQKTAAVQTIQLEHQQMIQKMQTDPTMR